MPSSAWTLYNAAKYSIALGGSGQIQLNTDSFSVALYTNLSNCGNGALATPEYSSVLTDEVANGNGYTTGGIALTTILSGGSSPTLVTFNCSTNPLWTASGSGIICRYAVMYDTTVSTKLALAYMLLDATPADVIAPSGSTLQIIMNSTIFSMG